MSRHSHTAVKVDSKVSARIRCQIQYHQARRCCCQVDGDAGGWCTIETQTWIDWALVGCTPSTLKIKKQARPKAVFRLCSSDGGGHVHLLFSASSVYSMERMGLKDGTNVASNFLGVCVRIKFLVCNIILGLEKSKIFCALRNRWIINVTYGVYTTDYDYVV